MLVELLIMLFNYSPETVRQGLLRLAWLLFLVILLSLVALALQRERLRKEQKSLNFSKKVSVREFERQRVKDTQKYVKALTDSAAFREYQV